MSRDPFFSVIVPSWNRATSVMRCICSILGQSFEDFELIVVDDASTDDTLHSLATINDKRLTVISHQMNKGVAASRGTGVKHAHGQWVVFVDSDWALMPEALRNLKFMAESTTSEVGILAGNLRMDTGEISPTSQFPSSPFGLEKYLEWADSCWGGMSDCLFCHRKELYEHNSWPERRFLEWLFFIRITDKWKWQTTDKILGIQYSDCNNRITRGHSLKSREAIQEASRDRADEFREVIRSYGPILKRVVPRLYWWTLLSAFKWNWAAGEYRQALVHLFKLMCFKPLSPLFHVQNARILFPGLKKRIVSKLGTLAAIPKNSPKF